MILGGAALAGFAARMQPEAPVPLLDGISCGVAMAEALVKLAVPKPRAGSFAALRGRGSVGLSPALAGMLLSAPIAPIAD